MRSRIGTLVIAATAVVTTATVAAVAVLIVQAHGHELERQVTRGADRLSETIKSSTHFDMLENRRDSLHRQIEAIGRQAGIEGVRIFNKEGRVVFSTRPDEVGRLVDKSAEACYACHAAGRPLERLPISARSRIFQHAGQRVLGIINPIHNTPACAGAACHAHAGGESVLGVLDVALSLADVDGEVAAGGARMAGLAALVIAGSSAMLWWLTRRLVLRPVEALAQATRRVADGDLSATIPVTARHELADLARDFNAMVQRLAETQRQLGQADKLASVGRLAAGVAHEINNPLTGVLTYASFLHKRAEDPATKEDLEVIVRETKRCREIVRGLLDFARPAPPRRQPTDVNGVVRRAVAILMNQLRMNHVGLDLDLAADLPEVPADPNQIQQVLVNLLVNAADAVDGRDGHIRLATRLLAGPAAHVEITVADTGRGISTADLPRVFEPFFTTKGPRGTGLGLAVTWGIVKAHGGTIDVASEEGAGSRFTVRLPVGEAP